MEDRMLGFAQIFGFFGRDEISIFLVFRTISDGFPLNPTYKPLDLAIQQERFFRGRLEGREIVVGEGRKIPSRKEIGDLVRKVGSWVSRCSTQPTVGKERAREPRPYALLYGRLRDFYRGRYPPA